MKPIRDLIDAINTGFMHRQYTAEPIDLKNEPFQEDAILIDGDELMDELDTVVGRTLRELSIEQHTAAQRSVDAILDRTRETLVKFQDDSAAYIKSLEAKIADAIIVRDAHIKALEHLSHSLETLPRPKEEVFYDSEGRN